MSLVFWRRWPPVARFLLAFLLLAVVAAAATIGYWLPKATPSLTHASTASSKADSPHADHAADHDAEGAKAHDEGHDEGNDEEHGDEHDHASHAGEAEMGDATHRHEEAAAITLSEAAQRTAGIETEVIALKPFERTISFPAMVVERPGKSHVQISTPITGIVSRVYLVQGEAVVPDQPLFDVRLSHEEVVEAQSAFLQTVEELDVVEREVVRLEKVAAQGAVAGKTMLERSYEKQKLEAVLRSQRQRLLLHGLTGEQIDGILADRTLLAEMTVFAASNGAPLLQVEEVKVDKGQYVKAGDLLCVLADYSELQIRGKAFEQDVAALDHVANEDWRVTAVLSSEGAQRQNVPDLRIMSLSNTIDLESRAFLFFVQLPNKLIRDRQSPDGHRFCAWQFKPGQRMELLVPVERWVDRIVLPREAVVQDGAESYVFEKNGSHFDRRTVHVEYRDSYSVVLANEGDVTPGKTIVTAGAYQIYLALKNKSGGAPDPHAGHNH